MGLVKYKNRSTGAVVEADFPLAEMPVLVEYKGDDGTTGHAAKADFENAYAQVLPDLPPVDPATVPTAATVPTEGSPVATLAPAPAPATEAAAPPPPPVMNPIHFRALQEFIAGEVFRLHDRLARLEAMLEKALAPAVAPPAPPAPVEKPSEPPTS